MTVQTNIQLKDVVLFKDLSSKELSLMGKILREKKFEKGEMLFEQSEQCENIIIVKTGRVKIFRLSAGGKEQILEVLTPGDTCACNPGKKEWSCSSWAEAITDCSIWAFPRTHYVELVKTNSRLAKALTDIFARRLCRFCSLIEQVSLDNPQQRLVKFLLDMIDSQESHKDNGSVLPFTQEEIAHRLGLTRETIARQLSQLKKIKLLTTDRNAISILNRTGLEKILEL